METFKLLVTLVLVSATVTAYDLTQAREKEASKTNTFSFFSKADDGLEAKVAKVKRILFGEEATVERKEYWAKEVGGQDDKEVRGQREEEDKLEEGLTGVICPPSYTPSGAAASCYKFVSKPQPWFDAQVTCMKDGGGGHLATIESDTEQQVLVRLLKLKSGSSDTTFAHIGGYNYDNDGVFKWLGTHNNVGRFWTKGFPKTYDGDCMAATTAAVSTVSTGLWVNTLCFKSFAFVCEMPGM